MELHHLNAFVVVAEELHFSRAARRLFMSQSGLSRSIRTLEREMGVVLLERSTRHVALTPAGERFLREARLALGQVDIAVQAARDEGSTGPAVLRVGYSEATEVVLSDALRLFRAECPDVALTLRDLDRSGPTGADPSRDWDVALCWEPVDGPDTVSLHVRDEPLWVSLPAAHPLATREAITLGDLGEAEPLFLPTGLLRRVRDAMPARQAGDSIRAAVQDVPTFAAAAVLVSVGVGVTLAPWCGCATLGLLGTVFRPLEDPSLSVPLFAVRQCGNPSRQVTALMRALRRSIPSVHDRMPIDAVNEYLLCKIRNTEMGILPTL